MIGIVIGTIAGVILVGLLVCWIIVCCKRSVIPMLPSNRATQIALQLHEQTIQRFTRCLLFLLLRTCSRYRKRKRQQRSVRYYSGAPSRQSSNRPTTYLDGDDEVGENQLNDDLMAAGGSDSPPLNIKGEDHVLGL